MACEGRRGNGGRLLDLSNQKAKGYAPCCFCSLLLDKSVSVGKFLQHCATEASYKPSLLERLLARSCENKKAFCLYHSDFWLEQNPRVYYIPLLSFRVQAVSSFSS